jgi:uroporphyrinogen-III decarboxylase
MRFELDIDCSPDRMEASRLRMAARSEFRYTDRVPVGYCVVPRFFAPVFGLRYLDYFSDAETQYRWQLEFARYRIEKIPEDWCTGPVVAVHPYFDNVIPPSAQGGEVGWVENGPPRALPVIRTVDEMDRFEVARPDAGLRGKAIEWWHRMKELASQTRMTFGGREGRVEVGLLALGGLSPHMIAIDLVGEDFYWWMLEYPEACHRFLAKIAQGEMEAEEATRRIDPRPRGDFYGLAEDSAQVISAELFREFCVPHTGAMFDRFGQGLKFGRGIHMCGDSRHLLGVLKKDLKMTHFDIFGYPVPPKVAAEKLGGDTLLWGNINPMLMRDGGYGEVRQAARECLEAMAPCGGLLLGDGANVCPGTPLESFRAVMDAAEAYGPVRQEKAPAARPSPP